MPPISLETCPNDLQCLTTRRTVLIFQHNQAEAMRDSFRLQNVILQDAYLCILISAWEDELCSLDGEIDEIQGRIDLISKEHSR